MRTLILGPSGSGKSSLLRRQLKENAAAGRRSILIVPEQFTSSTEGALYRLLGTPCPAMWKVTPSPRWPRRCCAGTAARRCPP